MAGSRTGDRLVQYALLMRVDRPIGTLLVLWPALWALWIAGAGAPDAYVTVVIVVGAFVMRSAGCVINDYADRAFDPHVRRTMHRPIAAGRVSPREALALFAVLGLAALGLVLTLNDLTVMLSFAGAALAASYPFMKRYTYLPQVHLGVAFGWAVPMAWAAQADTITPVAWLIMLAAVLWALVYDTMYAMVDREDDLYIGVKSTAILFGELDRAFVGFSQALVIVVLVLVGEQAKLAAPWYAGVSGAALLFVYQQWLIRDRDPARCFRAFLNNNWVGAIVFAGVIGSYLL